MKEVTETYFLAC